MIDQESYKLLLQRIVEVHFPLELEAFKLGSNEIVSQAMEPANPKQHERYGVDAGTIKSVLEIAVVAFNGWKIILEIIKLKKEAETDELKTLQSSLVKMLANKGMERSKAKAVAKDFFKELEQTIKK
jgi:hypothetical protein